MRPNLYLAQRMNLIDPPSDAEGADAFTSFQYMGSAEYEFNAIPKAFRSLKESSTLEATIVTHEGHDILVLGEPGAAEHTLKVCEYDRFKESPYFPWNGKKSMFGEPDGWLMLDPPKKEAAFAFFVNMTLARLWCERFGVALPDHPAFS